MRSLGAVYTTVNSVSIGPIVHSRDLCTRTIADCAHAQQMFVWRGFEVVQHAGIRACACHGRFNTRGWHDFICELKGGRQDRRFMYGHDAHCAEKVSWFTGSLTLIALRARVIFCSLRLQYSSNIIGTYETKPGTPLGEPERVNVLLPTTDGIAIRCSNLTAIGGTVGISEVRRFVFARSAASTVFISCCRGAEPL